MRLIISVSAGGPCWCPCPAGPRCGWVQVRFVEKRRAWWRAWDSNPP